MADGKVVSTMNTLDYQVPGTLPDPKTIYARELGWKPRGDGPGAWGVCVLCPHAERLSEGCADQVKRGLVLGKLGNTGNTSAPQLHFHLINGPSVTSLGLLYPKLS